MALAFCLKNGGDQGRKKDDIGKRSPEHQKNRTVFTEERTPNKPKRKAFQSKCNLISS